jgi:hypothetical protein
MTQEKNENAQEKKLIIDEDWKQKAQQEKEILAARQQDEKKQQRQQRPRGPLPKGNFAALLSMLATQAFFALGLLDVEGHEKQEPDLHLAKYNIDMLETLEEKTRGNLTPEEAKVLSDMLSQVRMSYVQVAG